MMGQATGKALVNIAIGGFLLLVNLIKMDSAKIAFWQDTQHCMYYNLPFPEETWEIEKFYCHRSSDCDDTCPYCEQEYEQEQKENKMENARKLSKTKFGDARLISVKDDWRGWEGCIWVKNINSLKEFDELCDEEKEAVAILKCPHDVPSMAFPTEYPYVRSECKKPVDGLDNCPFLFRYVNSLNYNCRLRIKDASKTIYEER